MYIICYRDMIVIVFIFEQHYLYHSDDFINGTFGNQKRRGGNQAEYMGKMPDRNLISGNSRGSLFLYILYRGYVLHGSIYAI